MRVVCFAAIVAAAVAIGPLLGWTWWPYLAWPATGIALIAALTCGTAKRAGFTSAAVALAVWTALIVVFIVSAYESDRDGGLYIASALDGLLLVLRLVLVVGVPLSAGTGVLAALASLAGKRANTIRR